MYVKEKNRQVLIAWAPILMQAFSKTPNDFYMEKAGCLTHDNSIVYIKNWQLLTSS